MKILHHETQVIEYYKTDKGAFQLHDGVWHERTGCRVTDLSRIAELNDAYTEFKNSFKLGDVVTVIGPEDSGHYENWVSNMEKFVGDTYTIVDVTKSGFLLNCDGFTWEWYSDWLIPAE
jgi:hypothetical protein